MFDKAGEQHRSHLNYVPVDTKQVATLEAKTAHPGRRIPYTTDFPFAKMLENKQGELRDIFALEAVQPLHGDLEHHLFIERVSSRSGRSHSVEATRKAIWGSREKGLFGCVDIKGNRFDDVHLQLNSEVGHEYPNLWNYYRVFGLYDSIFMSKIFEISKILMDGGVETEKAERIIYPIEYHVDGEKLTSLEEFRTYLKEKMLKDPAIKDKEKALEYINQFEPAFLVRSLQVPERMDDLHTIQSLDQLKRMMEKVFTFVNARSKILEEGIEFSSDNIEDIQKYFSTYLPKRIGRNLAKMHNIGAVHGYMHPQNISLAGSIYDLDSVELHSDEDDMENDYKDAELSLFTQLAQLKVIQELFPGTDLEFIEGFVNTFHDAYELERDVKRNREASLNITVPVRITE